MVSIQTVKQSNAGIASLPKGLVALFIGATSGIGQSALQQFAQQAPAPRIYTVARPQTAPSHENLLAELRQSNPDGNYNLITADVSLISEVGKAVKAVKQAETKVDILFLSAGFMPFEGRNTTSEGHDPSMTTRYYSRLRAVQQLLPLLNNAPSPRIISVLAGGIEAPINEDDLDLRNPNNWSTWNASFQSATMGTLVLEKVARENPQISIVHWSPGPVNTPGLARFAKFGKQPPADAMSQEDAGARALFFATNDRYSVHGSLVPAPEDNETPEKSGGGIFLLNPVGESTDNERVLGGLRERNVDETVWKFTEKVFEAHSGIGS
ncbi:hypothetical protein FSARC_4825 [Fusarium sarcochroum]|uniref:Oxidoreductase n=1 Tax=Fusarium sarcochroum TaxID=1208366 RepID=A0A8H4U1A7_9HYPO|nr:hypothetical protein FSARC_4825 [Fusarium sarcochroum]